MRMAPVLRYAAVCSIFVLYTGQTQRTILLMDSSNNTPDPRIEQFWKSYLAVAKRFRVHEHALPWYRKHAQTLIDWRPNLKLRDYSTKDVHDWLTHSARNPKLTEWQMRQRLDAARLLFAYLLKVPWASDFKWDRWLEERSQPPAIDPPTKSGDEVPSITPGNRLGKDHPELYQRFISAIRLPDYSINTERSYLTWINRFLLFHGGTHPHDCAEPEIAAFLEHLALRRKVAASTQGLALNALVFFFGRVLERPLGDIGPFKRPTKPRRLPTVLSPQEISAVCAGIGGMKGLMVRLMYGSGLRVTECVRLRVQDLDFDYRQITIRLSKGKKDRVVPMPDTLTEWLKRQLRWRSHLHEKDREAGIIGVYIPPALARKYPNAESDLGWQYLFPSKQVSQDPRSGKIRRHHIHQSVIQKCVRAAARNTGITKRVTSHTLRHSFATHLIASGTDIRTVQDLLGHADVSTTMIYTHVLGRGGHGVRSPLDTLEAVIPLAHEA